MKGALGTGAPLPRPRVVGALVLWEAERRIRSGRTVLAGAVLALWVAGMAAGDLLGLVVPGPDRGFAVGWVVALALGLGLGLAEDRELGLHRLLIVDFVRPFEYLLGKLLATGAILLAAGAASFLVLAALTGGGWGFAAWEAVALTLFGLCLLPALAVAETAVETRLPAVVVLLGLLVGLLVLLIGGGAVESAVAALGLDVRRGEWTSLRPLGLRALVLVVGGPFLVLPIVRLRLPREPRGSVRGSGPHRNIARPSASQETEIPEAGAERGRTQQVGEHQAEEGAGGPAPGPRLQQADPRDHRGRPRGRR